MRRLSALLMAAVAASTLLLATAGISLAGSVDPSTLTPPPPDGALSLEDPARSDPRCGRPAE